MYNSLEVYAHRGASSTAVENTMAAFEEARLLGATGVELDIHFTKDDVAVVFHDESLQRLTGSKALITALTIKEVMKLKQGGRFTRRLLGARITLLKEVLQWAEQYAIPLNIELKESVCNKQDVLTELLQEITLPKGSHISSFNEALLLLVRQVRPDIPLALIATKKTDWHNLADKNMDFIHAHKRHYTPEKVKCVAQAGSLMRLYGIEGTESFLNKPEAPVIGYITDYPKQVIDKIK